MSVGSVTSDRCRVEKCGTDGSGVLPVLGQADLGVTTNVGRVQEVAQPPLDRRPHDLGSMRDSPTDHHDAWIETVNEAGHTERDPATELVDDVESRTIPALGRPAKVDRVVTGVGPRFAPRVTSQTTEGRSRRVLFPTPSPSARALTTFGHDDDVTDLSGESVPTAQHPTFAHDPAPDAGPECHDEDVVVTARGSGSPFGPSRAVRVVVDEHRTTQTGFEPSAHCEVLDVGEVRGRHDDAITRDQTGHTEADRAPLRDRRAAPHRQRFDQSDEGVFDETITARRGHSFTIEDVSLVVDGQGQTFRPADIDPESHDVMRESSQDSARTFSSFTVLRMRTSARLFTKPGSGTIRSIERLYVTTTPPEASGANM